MDSKTLRKVQLVQLEIVQEIKRVCEKNNIKFFLDSGSLLGAIRHKGFIPWDDDLDIGMLRDDYERFCNLAVFELDSRYVLQTWKTDNNYPLPFAKVRKKNTIYLERRARPLAENGIFVDVFPYDYAPNNEKDRQEMRQKLGRQFKCLLMQCKWNPWIIHGRTNWKIRLYYLKSQILAIFKDRNELINEFIEVTKSVGITDYVYAQTGSKYFPKKIFEQIIYVKFENTLMPVIAGYHEWLAIEYGDYMTPPPENKRHNMHEIYRLDFGDGCF